MWAASSAAERAAMSVVQWVSSTAATWAESKVELMVERKAAMKAEKGQLWDGCLVEMMVDLLVGKMAALRVGRLVNGQGTRSEEESKWRGKMLMYLEMLRSHPTNNTISIVSDVDIPIGTHGHTIWTGKLSSSGRPPVAQISLHPSPRDGDNNPVRRYLEEN